MKKHWRELEPNLFIEPLLHQWGFFFNPPGQIDWQTGQRALDVYKCAAHVDSVLFIAAPLNAENRADAMALSVEGTIMRNANSYRPFTAGLHLGRHVKGDIYRIVPPAEAIGTLVANGAKGFHIYGYSGLDDGGVMYRMETPWMCISAKQSVLIWSSWTRLLKSIPKMLGVQLRVATSVLLSAIKNKCRQAISLRRPWKKTSRQTKKMKLTAEIRKYFGRICFFPSHFTTTLALSQSA